jgi:endoglycosylceramidase
MSRPGTRGCWSFTNGTFQFSYSTEEADGLGSFPAGSQTEISVQGLRVPGRLNSERHRG